MENNIVKNGEELSISKNEIEKIKQKIFWVRGKQVLLDSDVANLYHYKTKALNLAVKRNIERFPEEFCFQITEKELIDLRFQFETSKNGNENYERGRGGRRYLPYVFTEQGIAMLSGILKSEIAVNMSINIIKAFIEMRKILSTHEQIFERLTNVEYKLLEQDNKINQVFDVLQKDKETHFNQKIFFDGQIWDSYNLIINIIKKADDKILVIDNYIDYSILDMLSKKNKNVEVIILTSNNSNISKVDVQKFNKEYPILKIAKTNKFHDRFIIIDNKELYHCGASLKDLGKKCFGINKIADIDYINELNNKIKLCI